MEIRKIKILHDGLAVPFFISFGSTYFFLTRDPEIDWFEFNSANGLDVFEDACQFWKSFYSFFPELQDDEGVCFPNHRMPAFKFV